MRDPLIIKGLDSPRNIRISAWPSLFMILMLALVNAYADGDDRPATRPSLDVRLAAIESVPATPEGPFPGLSPERGRGSRSGTRTVNVRLGSGQTPARALTAAGVDAVTAGLALASLSEKIDMRQLKPGQKFIAEVDPDGKVVALKYPLSAVDYFEAAVGDEGFQVQKKQLPTDKEIVESACRIDGSLYESFRTCGLDRELVPLVVGLLESQFDLFTDMRRGDTIRLVAIKESLNGNFLRYGRIEGVLYEGKVASAAVFMHEEEDGRVSYWDAAGSSIERPFIRTPIKYNGYTSSQARRRLHPILHAYTPGRAVDYSAPAGTPVMAVADGKVIFAGYKSDHGRMVVIRHGNGIQTYYANLDSIRKGLTKGSVVDRRTQIGSVGTSARAKGSFLHFAVAQNGKFVHPRLLSDFPGVSMGEPQRHDFLAYVGRMTGRLRSLPVRGTEPLTQ